MKMKIEGGSSSMISGMSAGILASILTSIILAMLTAVLVINEKFSENGMHYFSFGITLVSSMIGGLIAGKRMGGKYALATFLTGGIYYLVLIGVGILLFDGLASGVWTILAAIGIGSICACTICITGKSRGRKRKTFSR